MTRGDLYLIAQEIGAELIRGPVRYPRREGAFGVGITAYEEVSGQQRDDAVGSLLKGGREVTLEAFKCPTCGSSDLEETAWDTAKCQHCGTVSRVSEDRLRLQILAWACPRCGFNNEREVGFCSACGEALLLTCQVCGVQTRAAAQFCEHCGVRFEDLQGTLAWLQEMKASRGKFGYAARMSGLIAEGSFEDVFDACAGVAKMMRVSVPMAHWTFKLEDADRKEGIISAVHHTGCLAFFAVWRSTIVIQRDTGSHRGLAAIVGVNRPVMGTTSGDIARHVAEMLSTEIRATAVDHLL